MQTMFAARLSVLVLTLVIALAVMFSAASVQAQGRPSSSAGQKFTVTVPTSVAIVAPTDVQITHDQTDNDQAFPVQVWAVKGNVAAGVTVTFSTNQPFTNISDATFKRDAKLDLAVATTAGPATWSISKATDKTNYLGRVNVATVQAASNGVGKANFNLSVSFLTNTFGSFIAGDYVTTVTGTITAN